MYTLARGDETESHLTIGAAKRYAAKKPHADKPFRILDARGATVLIGRFRVSRIIWSQPRRR